MSSSAEAQYYVRVRGRVQGPYELSRLKVLRARGQFSRVFEVSADGMDWVSSETLSELIDPAPPAPTAYEEPTVRGRSSMTGLSDSPPDTPWDDWQPRRRRKSESNLGTILLIVLVVIVPVAIVGGVVLMQRLEDSRALLPAESSVPTEEDRTTATFEYWAKFNTAREGLRLAVEGAPDALAGTLRTVAEEMARLPTLGVDTDAVELVIDYVAALRQVASSIQEANDPGTFFEALARGANGDPFGKVIELKSSNDAALREFADVEQRLIRVRASLTSTYSRQFP